MNKKVFFTLCGVIFTSALGLNIISPFISIYAVTLGANAFWLGVMFSGMSLAMALFSPVSGWLADRYSRKMIMVFGLVVYTLLSVGYVMATNFYSLTVVRLLQGTAAAAVTPVAQAYVGNILPKGKEGTYMNIFMMFMYLGMAFGPFLGGTLNDFFGMNWAFYSMGLLTALSLVFLLIFLPNKESRNIKKKVGMAEMLAVSKDNRIKASNLHLCSRAILRQGIVSFLPLYAVAVMGMDTMSIGLVLSVFIFVEAISQGLMGPVADRTNKKLLLIGGTLISAIISFFIGNMTTELTLILVLVAIAVLTSLSRSAALAYSVEVGSQYNSQGASSGVFNAVQSFGYAVGPILFGFVTNAYGLQTMFLVGGITGVIVIPFMMIFLLGKQPEAGTVGPVAARPVKETGDGGSGN